MSRQRAWQTLFPIINHPPAINRACKALVHQSFPLRVKLVCMHACPVRYQRGMIDLQERLAAANGCCANRCRNLAVTRASGNYPGGDEYEQYQNPERIGQNTQQECRERQAQQRQQDQEYSIVEYVHGGQCTVKSRAGCNLCSGGRPAAPPVPAAPWPVPVPGDDMIMNPAPGAIFGCPAVFCISTCRSGIYCIINNIN